MARTNKKTPTEDSPSPENQDEASAETPVEAALAAEEDRSIYALVQRLKPEGGKVVIYRQRGLDPDFCYIGEMPIDECSEGAIKELYGGGKYKLRFMGTDGKYRTATTLKLDPSARGKLELQAEQKADTAPLVTAIEKLAEREEQKPDNNLMVAMLQMQRESAQQMLTLLTQSHANTMAILAKSLERPAATVGNSSELLSALVPVLVESLKNRTSGLDELERLERLKEFIDGSSDKEDFFDKAMKVLAPVAAGLLTRGQPPGSETILPAAAPQPGADPHGVSADRPDSIPPTTQPASPDQSAAPAAAQSAPEMNMLKIVLTILLNGARNDTEPESYFDVICDALDERQFEAFITMIKRENWFGQLVVLEPEFGKHKPWLEELRTLFLEAEKQAEAGDAANPPPGQSQN